MVSFLFIDVIKSLLHLSVLNHHWCNKLMLFIYDSGVLYNVNHRRDIDSIIKSLTNKTTPIRGKTNLLFSKVELARECTMIKWRLLYKHSPTRLAYRLR